MGDHNVVGIHFRLMPKSSAIVSTVLKNLKCVPEASQMCKKYGSRIYYLRLPVVNTNYDPDKFWSPVKLRSDLSIKETPFRMVWEPRTVYFEEVLYRFVSESGLVQVGQEPRVAHGQRWSPGPGNYFHILTKSSKHFRAGLTHTRKSPLMVVVL